MKSQIQFFVAAALLGLAQGAFGQGTFQNLDFESAVLVPIPGDPLGRVEFAQAFPGWTGYIGTNIQTVADHNNKSLSEPGIAIMGPDYPSPNLFQGHYYARLYLASPGPLISAALAQTGTAPATAKSIRFYASSFDVPFLSFAGQAIPVSALGSTSTYTVFGGDISAFAGQTGELRFQGSLTFDNIIFADQPVPEPGTLALAGLGALLFGWRRWREASRSK